ncbi:MAG: class I SAM-dependent methyltransferase [Proteobacteria bacterium]|nr:class I SAM-dependent methyltransferase [Pseudomonadota bacterium]
MPAPLVVQSTSLNDYLARAFDEYFSSVFSQWPPPKGATLIELGCGRSVWLPYFATSYGLSVSGVDYSESGCNQARALLARDGIQGDIRHGDIFSPTADMLNCYDLVTSFGLVEHFSDTVDCLRHCAAFAKPGGLIITIIPNMFGSNGLLTRLINRPVFDIHVAMDLATLQSAHADAGLVVLEARYLMPINLNVVYPPPSYPIAVKKVINGLFSLISKSVWVLDRIGVGLPPTPTFAPYLACVAKKTG